MPIRQYVLHFKVGGAPPLPAALAPAAPAPAASWCQAVFSKQSDCMLTAHWFTLCSKRTWEPDIVVDFADFICFYIVTASWFTIRRCLFLTEAPALPPPQSEQGDVAMEDAVSGLQRPAYV